MSKIKQKLRSEEGASITFALLIFLVCAVISSVVLVAATAASGRISQQAEADQRYYSVTSAAELLKNVMDGKTVSIADVTYSYYITTYTNGSTGGPVPDSSPSDPKGPEKYLIDKKAYTIDESDLTAENKVPKEGEINTLVKSLPREVALNIPAGTDNNRVSLSASSSFASGIPGQNYDSLKVAIDASINQNGSVTFTVNNVYDDEGKASVVGVNQYKLSALFPADYTNRTVEFSRDYQTTDPVTTTNGDGSTTTTYSVKTEKKTVVISSYTWNFDSMTTIMAPTATPTP